MHQIVSILISVSFANKAITEASALEVNGGSCAHHTPIFQTPSQAQQRAVVSWLLFCHQMGGPEDSDEVKIIHQQSVHQSCDRYVEESIDNER